LEVKVILQKIIAIMVGGAFGAMSRYGLTLLVRSNFKNSIFPYGTLTVNVLGALLFGFFWAIFFKYSDIQVWRHFVLIGFLGSLTTFSSYTFDLFVMIKQGHYTAAALYFILSNVICLVGFFLAFFFTEKMLKSLT